MTEELKGCPFCGGKAIINSDGNGMVFGECQNIRCGCYLNVTHGTVIKAIEAWNIRALQQENPMNELTDHDKKLKDAAWKYINEMAVYYWPKESTEVWDFIKRAVNVYGANHQHPDVVTVQELETSLNERGWAEPSCAHDIKKLYPNGIVWAKEEG